MPSIPVYSRPRTTTTHHGWLARCQSSAARLVTKLLCLPFLSRQGEDRLTGGSACVGIIEVTEARQGAVATFFNHVNSSPVYRIPLTKAGRARGFSRIFPRVKEKAPYAFAFHFHFAIFILQIWIVSPTRGVIERGDFSPFEYGCDRKRGTNGLFNVERLNVD